MKATDWTYDLHVLGTRPRHLALEDFGQLVQRLADLLGSPQHVRFGALVSGSASIRAKVLEPVQHEVQVQLMQAKLGESSAASKVKKLDDYLASRGWHGELRNRQGGVVIVFPGATAAKPVEETRTVQQMDSLIGTVIKIGGRDETVPMQLRTQDGRYLDVTVRGRTKAQQLGSLLFQEVRVKGLATWQRDKEGVWACTGMLVDDFDQPNTRPLVDLFDEWAGLPGNDWQLIEDPEGEWLKIRGSEQ